MGIWRATSCCGCAPLRTGTLIIGGKGIIFGILFATLAVIMMPNVDGIADAINDSLRMSRQQAASCIFHASWRSNKIDLFLSSFFYVHDPNVFFQPLLMKILKHIFRVLSAHTGPFQGLNMIATDCQNCINNFHFDLFDTIFTKRFTSLWRPHSHL